MNSRARGVLIAAILTAAYVEGAAAMDVSFDGSTTGDWGLVNLSNGWNTALTLLSVEDFKSSGLNGISLDDATPGVTYYAAPESIYGTDLSGVTLNLNYEISSSGGASNFNTVPMPELFVNGKAVDLDIIDHTMIDEIQSVTIDFSDPAFAGIDLTNVSSLYIKAEWWGDNLAPESYLLGAVPVPEPATLHVLFAGLIGLVGCVRRQFA